MPQTFTQLHYHIIFSTKLRTPLIHSTIQDRLWKYFGGIVSGECGHPIQIGGVEDHVHLLVTLHQTQSVAEVVRMLKANSSQWYHKNFPEIPFWWQTGYAAFTVSHSAIPSVKEYIENQVEHHKSMTFQDELRLFLKKHGLVPDEEHMWN
jgi:REP element-mobilizing transposase RayT